MNAIERRRFLRWSAATVTALGLAGMPVFLRRALAAPMTPGKKLLFIFLRGGIDGIQAVIPYGDAGVPSLGKKSYLQARPTLGVDPAAAIDLNGFASLNPSMQDAAVPAGPRLGDIFHGTLDGGGRHLAVLHRIGYASQNRSHFSSQQFWENGVPGTQTEVGVFNRYITEYAAASNPLPAAAINSNPIVLLKGPTLVPVLRSIDAYALPANVSLGTAPSPPGDPLGSSLRGAYGQAGFSPAVPHEALTYGTGRTLLDGLQFFEEHVRALPYAPAPEAAPYYAAITDRRFAGYVQDAARLLKQVPELQIVGANQGGYDTHGGEDVSFPRLTRDLGLALTALHFDLKSIWRDTLVLTMSEFGRTSEENGNRGTDHAEATVMFAMGGGVKGGVYNADPSRWSNGDLFSTANGRYLSHRTDYRAVYGEVIRRHLGDPAGKVDQIIPGLAGLEAQDPGGYFSPLGFMA